MDDKILRTKKEMKLIIKDKKLTRLEKYNSLRGKVCTLSEVERNILLKECKRNYDSYDGFQDIERLITAVISGFGLIFTILNIIFRDKIVETIPVSQMFLLLDGVSAFVLFLILIFVMAQSVRTKNTYIFRYMIDILEEN